MKRWTVGVITVWVLLWSGVCEATGEEKQPASQAKRSEDQVLAQIGNTRITVKQLQAEMDALPTERRIAALKDPRGFLEILIREELLHQAAVREGVDKDPEVLKRLQEAKRSLLVEEIIRRKVLKAVSVTDQEVQAHYDQHPERFVEERVTASHILVKTREEAEAILKELQGGKKDFATLAKEHSLDQPSAEKGGLVGTFGRGQTVAEFEEAAFLLKPGEVSPPVQTRFGYHLIRVTEHSRTTRPFTEIKNQLRDELLRERQQQAFLSYLQELQKGVKVQVFEERLRPAP
jgi:peptidyl-prolyl cis-trans isomerase C